MKDKKQYIYVAVGVVLLGATYLLGMTQGYYSRISANNFATVFKSELEGRKLGEVDLSLLWDVIGTIDEKYIGTANYRDIAYGAIKGAVAGVGDPYTVFSDPEENEAFFNSLDGIYEGVGIEVEIADGALLIVAPLAGSPAEEAGIRSGDLIVAVDGKTVVGETLDEVISRIKGPTGTSVKLTVVRGEEEPKIISVRRQVIKRESVDTTIEDGIARIRIYRFAGDTEAGINRAVDQIKRQKVDKVILDLRGNPGGFLDAGVFVANEFLSGGGIVEERFKTGEVAPLTADGKGRLQDVKVVVLVNGGSASASEIVAGALQDAGRATIMGTQTYGKGSVQEVESFPDGSSLRVTVAKWYTPKGRSISDEGITPDKVVELEDNNEADLQLDAAKELLNK